MDEKRNKENLRRLYDEVMNGHRVDAADELITSDRPDHDPNLPPEFTEGREGFKRLFRMFIEAFPGEFNQIWPLAVPNATVSPPG